MSLKCDEIKAFKDPALGERVEILFDVGDAGSKTEFYVGTVKKSQRELLKDGTVKTKHQVCFDDGEKIWYDLVDEEKMGQLRWLEERGQKRPAEFCLVEEEEPAKMNNTGIRTSAKGEKHLSSSTASSRRGVENLDAVAVTTFKKEMKADDASTLSPPNSPASSNGFNSDLELDEMPASIDEIIRYMDNQEPSEKYFERQQDNRGGCSKTRKKLRTFANKNPTHIAVAHWKETGNWKPPNQSVLNALTNQLKTMIK